MKPEPSTTNGEALTIEEGADPCVYFPGVGPIVVLRT